MSNPNRDPKGIPTGGQFAAGKRAESEDLSFEQWLNDIAPTLPQPEPATDHAERYVRDAVDRCSADYDFGFVRATSLSQVSDLEDAQLSQLEADHDVEVINDEQFVAGRDAISAQADERRAEVGPRLEIETEQGTFEVRGNDLYRVRDVEGSPLPPKRVGTDVSVGGRSLADIDTDDLDELSSLTGEDVTYETGSGRMGAGDFNDAVSRTPSEDVLLDRPARLDTHRDTPFGPIKDETMLAPGIVFVTTQRSDVSEHGALVLSPSMNAKIPSEQRRSDAFYEADMDADVVMARFPFLNPGESRLESQAAVAHRFAAR